MSYLTANGIPCVRGRIILPLDGVWVADLVAEQQSSQGQFPAPGSSCTVAFGPQSFSGTVRRASSPFGTVLARVVGGAGGLPTQLDAKNHQSTTVETVLDDLLSDCGEQLASTAAPSILTQALAAWARLAMPGWQALAVLMKWSNPTGTWRVLPNGEVWVGIDTYPPTTMQTAEVLGFSPNKLEAEIFSETPSILPGQSFLGGQVSSVTHIVEPRKIKSRILFLDQQLAAVKAGNG